MKQVIPFYKEIVFKNNIANLVSISLEHNEKILDGEISGEFIVFGEYKTHNDTTETEDFKYKLPFTTIISDDIDKETINVDIEDFTYEQIENDVLRIDINFSVDGEYKERGDDEDVEILEEDDKDEEKIDSEIDNILNDNNVLDEDLDLIVEDNDVIIDEVEERINLDVKNIIDNIVEEKKEETVIENDVIKIEKENIKEENMKEENALIKEDSNDEYVTYHVHVVNSNDNLENIIKTYNTTINIVNSYNDLKELKIGDKIIIPEYLDE